MKHKNNISQKSYQNNKYSKHDSHTDVWNYSNIALDFFRDLDIKKSKA